MTQTTEAPMTQTPPPLNVRAIVRAGDRRAAALRSAELELDAIVAELEAAGPKANLSLTAKLTGVARSTLYRRLEERELARQENAKP